MSMRSSVFNCASIGYLNENRCLMYHRTWCVAIVCRRAFEFRRSGACVNWSATSDEACKLMAKDVNGPLAEALIKEVSHADSTCFDLFRFGALLFGDLPLTGNGVACSLPAPSSVASLQSKASRRNTKLFKRLGNDRFARELLACTEADARLGRMTQPVILEDFCPGCPLSLRFGVEQGINAIDGSLKLRPVDDFSASGVNECCRPAERLSTEGIDRLILVVLLRRVLDLCRFFGKPILTQLIDVFLLRVAIDGQQELFSLVTGMFTHPIILQCLLVLLPVCTLGIALASCCFVLAEACSSYLCYVMLTITSLPIAKVVQSMLCFVLLVLFVVFWVPPLFPSASFVARLP